jgi:hypothetical protein
MTEVFHNKARWFASLSNGENAVEGVGKFEEISGEPSPWKKLLAYCEENNLKITGMQIRKEGKVYTLPSANPKFGGDSPIDYKFGRKVVADMMTDRPESITLSEMHIFITAVYPKAEVTVWVDELKDKGSWITVKNL